MNDIYILLSLFFGHFLGDFSPLSTRKMNRAKVSGNHISQIMLHALVHATLVGLVCFIFRLEYKEILLLFAFQFITHFLIDLTKAKLTISFKVFQDSTTKPFWILFGFDQYLHAVVMILIWARIVS